MPRGRQRIAILGGGGAGCCAALEIVSHGHGVDIFEQDATPVMRASRVNEGKIHLGFLYANDATRRTAAIMARSALAFGDCMSRWLGLTPDDLVLSTPFLYAVHRDSLLATDQLRRHYRDCCAQLTELQKSHGLAYLGMREPPTFRELTGEEVEAVLDPRHFASVFWTSERAVDPREVTATSVAWSATHAGASTSHSTTARRRVPTTRSSTHCGPAGCRSTGSWALSRTGAGSTATSSGRESRSRSRPFSSRR
jgi:glycine/D-amino acid oxidase-like deaminating enzyme